MKRLLILLFVLSLLIVPCFAAYEQPTGNTAYAYFTYGNWNTSDFWFALAENTSYNNYLTYNLVDKILGNNFQSAASSNYTDYFTATAASQVYAGVYLQRINTHLNAFHADDGTYGWNGFIPNSSDFFSQSSVTGHGYGSVGDAFQTNLDYMIPAWWQVQWLLRDSLPEIGDFHDDFNDFYDYFSQSSSPVTFRYHYRGSVSDSLSRTSTQNEVAFLTASSGNRKGIETYTGSSLSFFDRLTLLNNNVVSTGTALLTPNTAYSQTLKNYATGSSTSYSFVSIGDMLHFLTRGVDSVRRLAFVMADDDDIQMKNDTQQQRDYIASQYASGGSAPSASDMGDVNSVVSDVTDVFETGYSISDVSTSIAYANDTTNGGLRFWSSWCSDALNTVSTTRQSPPEVIDWYSEHYREVTALGSSNR